MYYLCYVDINVFMFLLIIYDIIEILNEFYGEFLVL